MWSKGGDPIILASCENTCICYIEQVVSKHIGAVDAHYFLVTIMFILIQCIKDVVDLCGFAPEATNIAPQLAREITSSLAGIRCVFAFSVRLRLQYSLLSTLMHLIGI